MSRSLIRIAVILISFSLCAGCSFTSESIPEANIQFAKARYELGGATSAEECGTYILFMNFGTLFGTRFGTELGIVQNRSLGSRRNLPHRRTFAVIDLRIQLLPGDLGLRFDVGSRTEVNCDIENRSHEEDQHEGHIGRFFGRKRSSRPRSLRVRAELHAVSCVGGRGSGSSGYQRREV